MFVRIFRWVFKSGKNQDQHSEVWMSRHSRRTLERLNDTGRGRGGICCVCLHYTSLDKNTRSKPVIQFWMNKNTPKMRWKKIELVEKPPFDEIFPDSAQERIGKTSSDSSIHKSHVLYIISVRRFLGSIEGMILLANIEVIISPCMIWEAHFVSATWGRWMLRFTFVAGSVGRVSRGLWRQAPVGGYSGCQLCLWLFKCHVPPQQKMPSPPSIEQRHA